MASENKPELVIDGKRTDGRNFNQMRPFTIKANVIKNAEGSCYVEWGNNKILAAVYGPKEVMPRHMMEPDRAIIKCRYAMAPFSSLSDHGRTGPNRRAIEISKVIREVFENVVMLREYPASEIDIFIEVLQGDGGTRAAGITAAAVALANAGIQMRDLPYAISVGRIGEHIAIDFNMIEDNFSDSDMPMAFAPRNNEILLLQMDGGLDRAQVSKAIQMAIDAGAEISKAQRDALKEVYSNNTSGV